MNQAATKWKQSSPDYRRYEAEKRRLESTPMSPEAYQCAIKQLSRECGV